MNTNQFRFSSAAQLFANNFDVIRELRESRAEDAQRLYKEKETIVEELRNETYRTIAEFGDALLERLKELCEQDQRRFCANSFWTGQGYAGGKTHYTWIQAKTEKIIDRKPRDRGTISLTFPIPGKIIPENDVNWKNYWRSFDIITSHRVRVGIHYEGPDAGVKTRIEELKERWNLGPIEKAEEEPCYMVQLNPDNLVESAAKPIAALIRKVYAAGNSR